MYVYIRSEPGVYTVGFYKPDGSWEPDSDHMTRERAAARVAYLNGGALLAVPELLRHMANEIERDVKVQAGVA